MGLLALPWVVLVVGSGIASAGLAVTIASLESDFFKTIWALTTGGVWGL